MKNNISNLPPFYVGQEVVALYTSVKKDGYQVIKDCKYTVGGLTFCCGKWYVGLKEMPVVGNFIMCHVKAEYNYMGGPASKFAPIHTQFKSIEYREVMEMEKIGSN